MARRLRLAALLLAVAVAGVGCAAVWMEQHGHAHYERHAYDIDFFYDDLAPYGAWVDVDPYGWVWAPLDVPAGWRPYTVGYWLYTEDGWFWVSEDPWGWTPYHYGRWTWDRYYGWIWVPGDEWAPAWVAWRYGSGWVGWAPLPPDVHWRVGIGLQYTAFDLDRHIHRYRWSFTRARTFGVTRERVRVEPASRNVTLLQESRNVTKYAAGPRPVEQGMRPDLIRELRDRKIQRYRIEDSPTPIREKGATIRERSVEVFRPKTGVTAVVNQRVRNVPPGERPVVPPKLLERAEERRRRFEERVKAEREQLTEEHGREMREREPGVSAVELRRKQEAELRAQREMEERQKRVVESRERRVVEEREKVAKEREKAERERSKVLKEREKVEQERERVTKEREKAKQERERVIKEREKAKQERERTKEEPPEKGADRPSKDRGDRGR